MLNKHQLIVMVVVWITAIVSYYQDDLFGALMIPLGFTIGFFLSKLNQRKNKDKK